MKRAWLSLPRGGSLPEEDWRRRHRWIVGVLWIHALVLPVFALLDGLGALHAGAIGAVVAVFALAAGHERLSRTPRTLAAAIGLVTCSALTVHVWDATEAHFHFFVSVMALTVYEDWAALGAALGFLLVHHAALGLFDAQALYGHDGDPWMWAGVHLVFTLAAAAAAIATWGLNEHVRRTAGATEEALRASERRLLEEQATLRLVASVMRDIATKPDARESICAAAIELAGCTFASLWEHHGDRRLVLTACDGAELEIGEVIEVGKEASGAGVALLSGRRFFAQDGRSNPAVSRRLVEATGAHAVLFEPVRRGEEVVAVLALAWEKRIESLSARETSVVALLADETAVVIERSEMLEQLAALARTDPLTGLANRRVWDERLPLEIARAQRSGEPLAMLVLDLDGFKEVNDRHGHQAGDRMLKEVTARWREVIRPTDLLARIGGDEFVMLVPACPADGAVELADRLRDAMPDGLTCSVGVVEWCGEDPETFLTRGDHALYAAKAEGRDRTIAR